MITCSDLKLDQETLDDEYTNAMCELVGVLSHYFGRVQGRLALDEGLERDLWSTLHSFAQGSPT